MRIRKRQLALCSIPTATAPSPLPDLHLRRSEAPPPDQNTRWAEEKLMMKPKQFADDHDNTNNDIRKIVNICNGGGGGGGGGLNTNYILQSKIEQDDVDYKLVPLKKRKGINFETNHDPNPKTNNKSCAKKSKRGNVIMEGSRCSRVNGRGWRCCHPTLVGYSLCDHHLGKGNGKGTKKIRTKVAMVKARSINTLLCSPKFD